MTSSLVSAAGPRLGRGPIGVAVRVAAAIVMLAAANLVAGLLPGLVLLVPGAAETFGGSSPWGFALAAALQASVLVLVVVGVRVWMRGVERAPLRAAGWRWNRGSLVRLALGAVASGATVFAVTALVPATGPVADDASLFGDVPATPFLGALLIGYYLGLAFVQQGIPEELLFRGMLLWSMRERPVHAIAVTTLAFTAIHLVSQGGQRNLVEHVVYLALPLGFSLMAVGLLLWTRSLWAAVGVHGGFHVGTFLAAGLLPAVDPPTSWLAIGGAQSAVGLVLIVLALRRGRGIPEEGD